MIAPRLSLVEPDLLREFPGPTCLSLVAIGAAMIVLVLIRCIVLRRDAPGREGAPAALLPHEEALGALAVLEGGLPHEEQEKLHTAVAAIVKRYMARRFDAEACCKTTEELLASFNAQGGRGLPLLDLLLLQCDRVKFSGRPAPSRSAEACLVQARDFVIESASSGEVAP